MKDLNAKFTLSADTKVGFAMERDIHAKKRTRNFLEGDMRERIERERVFGYCGGKISSN